jgi:hypothetical protein
MLHLLIADRFPRFTRVNAVSASMIGMFPSLAGLGIYSELLDIDAFHTCNDSQIAVIKLGQRMAWL